MMELKTAVYGIAEAASLLGCQPQKLLDKGMTGEVNLLVRVPDHLDVYNAGYSEVQLDRVWLNEGEKPEPFRQSDAEFLVLPQQALNLLSSSRVFGWGTFSQAGRLREDSGDVEIVEAVVPATWPGMLLAQKSVDVFNRCFATYRPGLDVDARSELRNPQRFKISIDDLLLSRLDLVRLLDSEQFRYLQLTDFPQLDVQPHTSQMLRSLYDLFCRAWKQFGSSGFLQPQRDPIFLALRNEFKFSENAADFGVKVIVRDVIAKHDEAGVPRIVAEKMNALIRGADFHWKTLPGIEFEVKDTENVADWFTEEYRWARSVAKNAAGIIRPDYAPRGRPRKSAK